MNNILVPHIVINEKLQILDTISSNLVMVIHKKLQILDYITIT